MANRKKQMVKSAIRKKKRIAKKVIIAVVVIILIVVIGLVVLGIFLFNRFFRSEAILIDDVAPVVLNFEEELPSKMAVREYLETA
jgi:flagellar biogenesis protein FliO